MRLLKTVDSEHFCTVARTKVAKVSHMQNSQGRQMFPGALSGRNTKKQASNGQPKKQTIRQKTHQTDVSQQSEDPSAQNYQKQQDSRLQPEKSDHERSSWKTLEQKYDSFNL